MLNIFSISNQINISQHHSIIIPKSTKISCGFANFSAFFSFEMLIQRFLCFAIFVKALNWCKIISFFL